MEGNLKKLRKLENTRLLLVSEDSKFISDISEFFNSCKEFKATSSNKEALNICHDGGIDAVIIDSKSEDFKALLSDLGSVQVPLIKIIALDDHSEENILNAVNAEVYTILAKPFSLVNLKLSVIMSLNQSKRSDKVKLGRGFYFDTYRDRVYNRNGKAIELTKLEFGLLKLIIENWGEVVDYDTIEKKVWKGKKMSIFTMRNVVNKIRTKTYYDIFKNASSKGYIIG